MKKTTFLLTLLLSGLTVISLASFTNSKEKICNVVFTENTDVHKDCFKKRPLVFQPVLPVYIQKIPDRQTHPFAHEILPDSSISQTPLNK